VKNTLDPATGDLLTGGKAVFPLGLSDGPPLGSATPEGVDAWTEISRAGVRFLRNYTVWSAAAAAEQMFTVTQQLDAASTYGLQVWLALAGVDRDLSHEQLLDRIVDAVKGHPGLGVWKGVDEPAHARVPPAGCVAVYKHLKARDPDHPVVIVEAPRAADGPLTTATVAPYAAACDIHGVDIYPVSRPPGRHAGGPPVNTDISVVGDVTKILARASRHRPIWTTLQIAWSGVLPPHPLVFPTLQQARFMAYDAIVSGARGLFFFGGHIKAAMSLADRQRGWNWTYWNHVQKPLLEELSSAAHEAALIAPLADATVTADARDVALSARQAGGFLYLIAVRKSPTAKSKVRFSGLPRSISEGTVLAHGPSNPQRHVTVAGGAVTDPSPYAPHNARVYRFRL
jgi:hypothetical protein